MTGIAAQGKAHRGVWGHPLVRLVVGFVVAAAVGFGVNAPLAALLGGSPIARLVAALMTVGLAYSAYYLVVVRWMEHRSTFDEMAPRAAWTSAAGLLLGTAGAAIVLGSIALFGTLTLSRNQSLGSALAVALAGAIAAGFIEELLIRGVLFRLVEEWLGTWIALGVSAVIFGAMHLMNQDASLWGAIAIAVEAGVTLAVLYMVTRSLWLAIGAHVAWNFWQYFLGIPVSGTPSPNGHYTAELTGPAWLTGGAFGYEGSVVTVVVWMAIAAVFLTVAIRRGQIRRRKLISED